jgi:hypothetical protein
MRNTALSNRPTEGEPMGRRFRGKGPVAIALAAAACLALGAAAALSRESAQHVRLHEGDYVSIPALRWTCLMSNDHGRPLFTCTTDTKPVRSLTITPHQLYVGITRRPVIVHGGYRFTY